MVTRRGMAVERTKSGFKKSTVKTVEKSTNVERDMISIGEVPGREKKNFTEKSGGISKNFQNTKLNGLTEEIQ